MATINLDQTSILWYLITGMGIANMQLGFMLVEVGNTQSKHVKSVIMKNVCDFSFGVLAWYLIGYGLFTGANSFAAGPGSQFATTDASHFAYCFQQFGFASTTITIVSGSIVGRGKFEQYLFYSTMLMAFIYPVIGHWIWNPDGWLKVQYDFRDFAGSCAVHSVGGTGALIYAYLCGPREGRFWTPVIGEKANGKHAQIQVREMKGHSPALAAVGVLMLYVSWFSFNGGSVVFSQPGQAYLSSQAIFNTFIATGAAVVSGVVYSAVVLKVYDLSHCLNSMLAGLVAITAPCGYVEPWAAVVIGLIAPLVTRTLRYFIIYKFHIDDPVDAVPVHLGNGFFGTIITGIFDTQKGLVYTGKGDLLLAQFIGFICVFVWTSFWTFFILLPIHKKWNLSVPSDAQIIGLDAYYFDGYAFPDQNQSVDLIVKNHDAKVMKNILRTDTSSSSDLERSRIKKVQKLVKLLDDHHLVAKLKAFLDEYHEGEGIDFILAVKKFENEQNPFTRSKMSRSIITNFVLEQSAKQVNLLGATRTVLSEFFLNGSEVLSHIGLFKSAVDEVMHDLADNTHVTIFLSKNTENQSSLNVSRNESHHSALDSDEVSMHGIVVPRPSAT